MARAREPPEDTAVSVVGLQPVATGVTPYKQARDAGVSAAYPATGWIARLRTPLERLGPAVKPGSLSGRPGGTKTLNWVRKRRPVSSTRARLDSGTVMRPAPAKRVPSDTTCSAVCAFR